MIITCNQCGATISQNNIIEPSKKLAKCLTCNSIVTYQDNVQDFNFEQMSSLETKVNKGYKDPHKGFVFYFLWSLIILVIISVFGGYFYIRFIGVKAETTIENTNWGTGM